MKSVVKTNTLPSPPGQIFKFELSDAAVPNKHTEETIRLGRARNLQLQQQKQLNPTVAAATIKLIQSNRPSTNTQPASNARNPRPQRHGRTSDGDLATDESRVVQIRLPIAADTQRSHLMPKYPRQHDGNINNAQQLRQFPVEVRNVIEYVLKKGGNTKSLHKTLSSTHQSASNAVLTQPQKQLQLPSADPLPTQWWQPQAIHQPLINYAAQQYVPDMAYNTIQASVPQQPPKPTFENIASDPPPSQYEAGEPFRILIPSMTSSASAERLENTVSGEMPNVSPAEPPPTDQPLTQRQLPENWFVAPVQVVEEPKRRPQDSTAPVLFPLGARLPLPPSNFSAAVVNKYQTLASIATPVVSADFYHLPGEPAPGLLAVADNAQQYYNELDGADDPSSVARPAGGGAAEAIVHAQQFYPPALFYSPKDHTPIIEPPAEEDVVDGAKATKLAEKPAYGFVPTKTIVSVPKPPPQVTTLFIKGLVPHEPAKTSPKPTSNHVPPQPTSYSKFRGSIAPQPLNWHQYAAGYQFGYRVRDAHSGNDFGHTQNRAADGRTHGQYHILLPDGRLQSVKYMADDKGFHADVRYNGESASVGAGAGDSRSSASAKTR